MHSRQFGINYQDGLVKTAFMNDWMHSIFHNRHAPIAVQKRAQNLIGSQIVMSLIGLAYFSEVRFWCFRSKPSFVEHLRIHGMSLRTPLLSHEPQQRHQKSERCLL